MTSLRTLVSSSPLVSRLIPKFSNTRMYSFNQHAGTKAAIKLTKWPIGVDCSPFVTAIIKTKASSSARLHQQRRRSAAYEIVRLADKNPEEPIRKREHHKPRPSFLKLSATTEKIGRGSFHMPSSVVCLIFLGGTLDVKGRERQRKRNKKIYSREARRSTIPKPRKTAFCEGSPSQQPHPMTAP